MAEVRVVVGVPHNPFHLKLTRAPREEWSDGTRRMVELGGMMASKIEQARPDAIIVVGNDHFHQFFMDNMPAFLVGKMARFDGIFHNEMREFDMEPCTIPGDVELAAELLEGGLSQGVDFSYSDQVRLDHAIVTPLLHLGLRPALDVPIVPILTNCVAPPLPPARRFYEVGLAVREVIESMDADKKVAVVASGNVSLEVGGPRQFLPEPMDEEFDELVAQHIGDGDAGRLIDLCSFERMTQAGNVTHAVTNFVLGMGIAEGFACTYAESMRRPGSSQPFFAWEPTRGTVR